MASLVGSPALDDEPLWSYWMFSAVCDTASTASGGRVLVLVRVFVRVLACNAFALCATDFLTKAAVRFVILVRWSKRS